MTNEIINLLPSQKLKNKIRESGHVFTETELLYIISIYAPTFDKKLEMLSRFAETASPEVANAAHHFIRWYKNHFNAFFDNSCGAVYKVRIWKDHIPGMFNDNFDFLASSYEAALKGIDRYYREYEEVETEKARYKIIKKHLFTGDESEDDEFPDYLGECWLGAGKILLEVNDDSVPYDFSDADDSISPYNAFDLEVPNLFRNRDIVLYKVGNKAPRYGVILAHHTHDLCNHLYAIPLDSDFIRHHHFEDSWLHHDHPYAHEAIVVTPDELPQEMRNNYFAFMKFLDEHYKA